MGEIWCSKIFKMFHIFQFNLLTKYFAGPAPTPKRALYIHIQKSPIYSHTYSKYSNRFSDICSNSISRQNILLHQHHLAKEPYIYIENLPTQYFAVGAPPHKRALYAHFNRALLWSGAGAAKSILKKKIQLNFPTKNRSLLWVSGC